MTRTPSADSITAPVAAIGRRRFLKWSLVGGASLAAFAAGGFALLRRSPLDDEPRPDHLGNMSQQEFLLFRRVIPVLLPMAGTRLTSLEEIPVLDNINHTLGLVPAAVRPDLAMGLSLFDNAAVVAGWHGKRLVDLEDEAIVRYFDDWSRGNTIQRALATVVKKLVYISYWRDPASWPPVEFDGPVSEKWGVPDLGNAPLPAEDEVKSV